MARRPQRSRRSSSAEPPASDRNHSPAGQPDPHPAWEAPPGDTSPAIPPGPPGPRRFGKILWATDWRPGESVELIRPGPSVATLLLLAGIPAGAVALLCLFQLPHLSGTTPAMVSAASVVFALGVGAIAAIWVTGVNPRRRIVLDWSTRELRVTTVAGTRRWPFSEIRRLTKYQKNQHVQLSAGLPKEQVVLFDSDDHGLRGLEMPHQELTPLAMELTKALDVPPFQGRVAVDHFSWIEIVRQSSVVARVLLAGLLGWCVWAGFWQASNWLLAVPLWIILAFLQFGLPVVLGVRLGQRWYAGGGRLRVWLGGGVCLTGGVLLFAGAVWAWRHIREWRGVNLGAALAASLGTALALFGLGILAREHLRPVRSGRDWTSDDD